MHGLNKRMSAGDDRYLASNASAHDLARSCAPCDWGAASTAIHCAFPHLCTMATHHQQLSPCHHPASQPASQPVESRHNTAVLPRAQRGGASWVGVPRVVMRRVASTNGSHCGRWPTRRLWQRLRHVKWLQAQTLANFKPFQWGCVNSRRRVQQRTPFEHMMGVAQLTTAHRTRHNRYCG